MKKNIPGNIVIKHIEDITPSESDIPDYFIRKYIKGHLFAYDENFKIKTLMKSDPDFKEYFESGENRYEDEELPYDELYNAIVVVKGTLLDGYSRCTALLKQSMNATTEAYVR